MTIWLRTIWSRTDRIFCIHHFFLCDSQFLSYGRFCILPWLTSERISVASFAKYAVFKQYFSFYFIQNCSNYNSKDAECSETNEKSIFQIFIFRVMVIFALKI